MQKTGPFKVKRIQIKWNKKEDSQLLNLTKRYGSKDWAYISSFFINKSSSQCLSRYTRIKPGILKGPWTIEENNLLLSLHEKHGSNWSMISKTLTTRTGKQIRDRYLNFYSNNVTRIPFNDDEDKVILDEYNKQGPKWTKIAEKLPGRTGDLVKNRFYSSLRKTVNLEEYSQYLEHKRHLFWKNNELKHQSKMKDNEESQFQMKQMNDTEMTLSSTTVLEHIPVNYKGNKITTLLNEFWAQINVYKPVNVDNMNINDINEFMFSWNKTFNYLNEVCHHLNN